MAPEKEINYFDVEIDRGADWYEDRFAAATDEVAVGEGSVSYLFSPEAPARMAALVPDAQLVAILRDPVDRAYSHWAFRRSWGAETRPFAVAVAEERRHEDDPAYLGRGRYLEQLE